jgi:hypothetical protein
MRSIVEAGTHERLMRDHVARPHEQDRAGVQRCVDGVHRRFHGRLLRRILHRDSAERLHATEIVQEHDP